MNDQHEFDFEGERPESSSFGKAGLDYTPEASPQYRASLIFLSYRFSQGGIGTQNRLLLNIEEEHIPSLFADEQLDEVKSLAWKMVASYFLNQKLHPATAIPWEDDRPEAAVKTEQLVTNELTGLFERFRDREQLSTFTGNLVGVAQSVIVMDADYLNRPGGRGGDSEDLKIKVDPYTRDPYDSTFIKYGILETSTNTHEFDDIFQKIANEQTISQLDSITLRQLLSNIDIYVKNHPDGIEDDKRIVHVRALCSELLHGQ